MRSTSPDDLRHGVFELGDGPAIVLLDLVDDVPGLEHADPAALDVEHLAGGGAVLGRQPGDDRADVGRVPDVETARLGRWLDLIADAGRGEREAGPRRGGDGVDPDPVARQLL